MKKIFKHIFAMFLKTKVIFVGLITLVFFTAVIFTTLFTTNRAYGDRLDEYKNFSGLHDATINTEFNYFGNAQNEGYDELKPEVYQPLENEKSKKQLIIKDNFISLGSISPHLSNDEYVLSTEFSREFYFNATLNDDNTFSLSKQAFLPVYITNDGKNFQKKVKSYSVTTGDTITLDRTNYKANDILVYYKQGDKIIINFANPLVINGITKQATFDPILGSSWQRQGIGFELKGPDLYSLLKIKQKVEGDFEIENSSGSFVSFTQSGDSISGRITSKTFNLTKDINWSSNEFKILDPGQNYQLLPNWVRDLRSRIEYINHKYKLKEIDENSQNFTGFIKEYLLYLKNNEPKQFQELQNINYWEKRIITTEGDHETIVSADLSISDLTVEFQKKGEPSFVSTIAQIEKLNNNNLALVTNEELNNLSNSNIKNATFLKLSQNVQEYANIYFYNYLQNYSQKVNGRDVKVVDSIGTRQTFTIDVQQKGQDSTTNQVIHFINSGISPEIFNKISFQNQNLDQQQQLGRLFNEIQDYKSNRETKLFPQVGKILDNSNTKIPAIFQAKVIAAAHESYGIDPNLIDLKVTFGNVEFQDDQKLLYQNILNTKIVLLKKVQDENPIATTNTSANLDFHGIILLPNYQFGYVFKNLGEIKWTLLPENIIKTDNTNPGSREQRTQALLANFLENKNFEIDAKISDSGWFKRVDNYSNTATIPLIYYYFSTNVQNEIDTQKSARSLFLQAADALNNSVLVDNGFFLKPDVDAIFNALALAADEIKLVDILAFRIKNYNLLSELLVKAGHILTKNNRPTIINDVLANFVDQIIAKTEQSATTNSERSLYLVRQIFSLNSILSAFGVDIFDQIQRLGGIEALAKAIKNPINLLNGFQKVIYSIDFEKLLDKLNAWFEETNKNKSNLISLFSGVDFIKEFLASIDQQRIKAGLIDIVNEIDFNAMFSTVVDEKTKGFFGFLTRPIVERFAKNKQAEIIKILTKLNGKGENNPYSNINEGLIELITNFDIPTFVKNLDYLTKNVFSDGYDKYLNLPENLKKAQADKEFFKRTELQVNDYLIALVGTFLKDEKTRQSTINSLIKIINASSKGQDSGSGQIGLRYFLPGVDDQKIDIYDLQFISSNWNSVANTDNLQKSKQIDVLASSVLTKLSENPEIKITNLTLNERIFLNRYLRIVNLDNVEDIKNRLQEIKDIFEIFNFKNYTKTGNIITNIKPPSLDDTNIFANYESIGDILYFLTNSIKIPASQVEDGNASAATPLKLRPIYISASADLIDKLQDSITSDPSSIIGLTVRNYRFWIRFVAENNLANLELQQAFNKLYSFANSSSTNTILNDTTLFGGIKNLQNQEGLFAGLPAASRSILQPYLTSLHLNNNTEFKNLLNDPVFDKEYTDQHGNKKTIKSWLIENQTELVENLGYLAYYAQNYPFEANFNKSVKYIMDNFLLENKFSDSPFKKRFLSTLVSQYATLNPLLVGLNLESLGLGQFFSAQLPQIPLWFSTNPDAQIETEANNFNLAFILQSRIPSIRQVQGDPSTQQSQLIDLLSSQIKNNEEIPPFIHSNLASSVSLDYYKLKDISALIFEKSKDNPEFFGINIYKFYEKFFEKIIVTRIASNSINIDDNRAYVIKVNNSYLEKNQKEIYQGKIPDNASDIEKLIDQLDDKYILNAAGLKYIIVGSDFSVDYLYPVIDEKNIQLDPSNQALAYVNKFGFDKARFSYRSNPVKNYLLIKLKPEGNLEQFKQDTDDLIAKNFSLNRLQRTFSADEIDFLNPERSLRISVGTNIISTFSSINIYITLFLSLLVLFAVAFIIKRYISTNNKVLGILRAQGYTLFEIASSFLSIGLMISFIGGLLGYLVGFFVKIPLVGLISQFWEFDVNLYSFEPISFVFSFVVPFVAISALIYLVILWNLKQKPNQLLSGISEINTSKFAQGVARLFRKTKIVNKFSISLVINSTWKIISLIIAIIIVQFALIFSLSSHNIFQNTITKTYLNRHYTYKLNLFSPTREGGPLVVYNPKNLEKNLYVPIGSGSEINTNSPNYFRPGNPSVFGDTNQNGEINTNSKNPVVLSRSGLNIKISESNNLSIFDIVLSNLPESLRNNIFSISNKVVLQMEQSQNIEERIANKQPYFKYLADPGNVNLGRFWYFKFDPVKNDYLAHEVSIFGQVKNRDEYRKFLVESYLNANVEKDFTVSFAGISLSPNADKNAPQNQVYTYIDTFYNNGSSIENGLKIYGYNTQSQNNPIIEIKDESNQDLLKAINDFKIENDIYPLVVNHVFAKKHNLGIDSLIEMPIINTIDRYLAKIRDIPQKTAKFKIIGISDTYINSELITSQDVANKLLGLDIYDSVLEFYNLKPFNGLILASPDIEQITNSFTLYSPSGYWAGSSEINVDSLNNDDTIGYFANIFAFSQDEQGQKGALQLAGYSKDEILKIINLKNQQQNATWVNQNSNLDFSSLTDPTFVNQNLSSIKQSLKNFNEIYGNTIYQIAAQGVEAKNIETNFISNFANLFGAGINIVVIVFLAVSLIILIIIASSIINENQENIAILDVLGYSNRTKLRLFYSIYLPILILATLISVPFAMLGMGIFSSYILASNSIFLALAISVPVFFGALLIISVIFFSVLAILWRFLTNRKSVYVIKEKT
ncbi:ABC transporter permease [Mesomycoplasma ovipneumoniae]|uniref:ABC transporter permease n=1 Tax=Mesomycoplasma ovipneumoniae TaxID=29562 RepID=UPI00083E93A7|nr:ABC transporter permease [Mesomycoplasma ovipneumoniae]